MSRYLVKWIVDKKNDNIPFQVWEKSTIPRYDKPDDPYFVLEAVIDAVEGEQSINDAFKIYSPFFKMLNIIKVHDNFGLSERNFNYDDRTNLYFGVEDCEEQEEEEIIDHIERRLKAVDENTRL